MHSIQFLQNRSVNPRIDPKERRHQNPQLRSIIAPLSFGDAKVRRVVDERNLVLSAPMFEVCFASLEEGVVHVAGTRRSEATVPPKGGQKPPLHYIVQVVCCNDRRILGEDRLARFPPLFLGRTRHAVRVTGDVMVLAVLDHEFLGLSAEIRPVIDRNHPRDPILASREERQAPHAINPTTDGEVRLWRKDA